MPEIMPPPRVEVPTIYTTLEIRHDEYVKMLIEKEKQRETNEQ
jgi:hypothetical protein